MSKKGKIRAALGGLLALTLVVTCVAVYQSGSKSTPNEKEFVKEDEKDSVDEAIKTEEREEEETEDANTSDVEGTKAVEEEKTPEEEIADTEVQAAEDAAAEAQNQAGVAAAPDVNFTESSLMEWPVNGQVVLDYNMDNTVYFPTLNVYKLNPAVAISAEVGSPVAAVANGKIVSVTENGRRVIIFPIAFSDLLSVTGKEVKCSLKLRQDSKPFSFAISSSILRS